MQTLAVAAPAKADNDYGYGYGEDMGFEYTEDKKGHTKHHKKDFGPGNCPGLRTWVSEWRGGGGLHSTAPRGQGLTQRARGGGEAQGEGGCTVRHQGSAGSGTALWGGEGAKAPVQGAGGGCTARAPGECGVWHSVRGGRGGLPGGANRGRGQLHSMAPQELGERGAGAGGGGGGGGNSEVPGEVMLPLLRPEYQHR
jgi:hypothetical protein